jgi:hypothetical protein
MTKRNTKITRMNRTKKMRGYKNFKRGKERGKEWVNSVFDALEDLNKNGYIIAAKKNIHKDKLVSVHKLSGAVGVHHRIHKK